MKRSIAEYLMSDLPKTTNAKEFFNAIGERYQVSDNTKVGHLMSELRGIRYDNSKGIREYILRMVHTQSKLRNF